MEFLGDKTSAERLSFVRRLPEHPRRLVLLPYFDGADWWVALPVGDALELGKVQNLLTGSYYGVQAADAQNDFESPLSTLLLQHLSFPGVTPQVEYFETDIHRCAAVLEKYKLISGQRRVLATATSLLAASELEYLLMLLRSYYDVTHTIFARIAQLLAAPDGARHKIHKLPVSFADVAVVGDNLRSASEIAEKWKMPQPLAAWYTEEAGFFFELRKWRDGIAHRGQGVPTIFELDQGLAVDIRDKPWERFNLWSEDQLVNKKLGPLRKVFAAFVAHSLSSSARLARLFRSHLRLPEAIHSEMKVYLRSPVMHRITGIAKWLASPWEASD